MGRLQIILIGIAAVLLATLFLFGRTKPNSLKDVEESRLENAQKASINEIVAKSKATLSEAEANLIAALEGDLDIAGSDSAKLGTFKKLSSTWYQLKNFAASGFYAEEVALIDNSDSAWSIAGINYALCFSNTGDERTYNYCYDKAITAFESAISIAPDSMVYKENLAYCYTQNNDPSQVMKGIKIYQGILDADSTNIKVLLTLGKISVERTQDYPKALKRLKRAVEQAPNNFEANYYLAVTYAGLNQLAAARQYYKKALSLTNDNDTKQKINTLLNNL